MKKTTLNLNHPGKHLLEILDELGVSQYRFAHISGVPASAICSICKGRRAITAPVALRIARALGMSPQFWVNYQARYDLEGAERNVPTSELAKIKPLITRPSKLKM